MLYLSDANIILFFKFDTTLVYFFLKSTFQYTKKILKNA
ncbi:hypothetical protein CCP3SC1AL1_850006 [Gammaproteobacteria bacterium]